MELSMNLPVRVLVVDDNPVMRSALRASLAAHGYSVIEACTGEDAAESAVRNLPELILLDVEMPGIGGFEACRRVRSALPQTGVLMITVRDTEEDKIQALEAGADDYITKPFRIRELLARLGAIRRRLGALCATPVLLCLGDLELDTHRHTLRKAGTEVRLSPTEFSLLSYLMQHADAPVGHAELLRAVWGPEYGSELEYLRTYIKRLRKKIEFDANQPKYLVTLPWLGYCFQCSQPS